MKVQIRIEDLIKADSSDSETILQSLEKHLRATASPGYKVPTIFHSELLQRATSNAAIIAQIKSVQWRIVNYSVLLLAALAGIPAVFDITRFNQTPRTILAVALYLLICIVTLASMLMIKKTDDDLEFYRQHSRINDRLLTATTGITQTIAIAIEKSKRKFKGTSDYGISSRRNWLTFTLWFYVTLVAGAIISVLICSLRIWMEHGA